MRFFASVSARHHKSPCAYEVLDASQVIGDLAITVTSQEVPRLLFSEPDQRKPRRRWGRGGASTGGSPRRAKSWNSEPSVETHMTRRSEKCSCPVTVDRKRGDSIWVLRFHHSWGGLRCAHGQRDGMKSITECVYRAQFDVGTCGRRSLPHCRGESEHSVICQLPLTDTRQPRLCGSRVVRPYLRTKSLSKPHLGGALRESYDSVC